MDISAAWRHQEKRDQFSTGRELRLNPPQDGKPRSNCFVYPYMEVDGQEYPTSHWPFLLRIE